ncbi:MAG: hypothetical protein KF730_03525 [Sphingomonas sp.]|uniref:hypothetical protein n=1 Tax=Sphingomonas sp. TaxID=28214 RepID=UPI0025D64663|nr:hypothetical protein [Sphingomonas sp.]MBX3563628.1 hypothetical protein [Sphingomonas sp.]
MKHWKALAAALLVPLALAACLFVPGKFTSVMTVHADRSFTYSYKGEVIAVDLAGQMTKAMGGFAAAFSNTSDDATNTAAPDTSPEDAAKEKAEQDAKYREIAAQLVKEAGYTVVEYRGDGKFYVEYAISGVLTHNFVFPYNQDTGLLFPFVAIELRGKDQVRIKAPAFAKQRDGDNSMGASEEASANLDGTFTLITDAEIVSQNQEEGAKPVAAGKSITWKVSPTSEDAPTAMLRVKGI